MHVDFVGHLSKKKYVINNVASIPNRCNQDSQPSFDLGINDEFLVEDHLLDKENSVKCHFHVADNPPKDQYTGVEDFVAPHVEVEENNDPIDLPFEVEENHAQSKFNHMNMDNVPGKKLNYYVYSYRITTFPGKPLNMKYMTYLFLIINIFR